MIAGGDRDAYTRFDDTKIKTRVPSQSLNPQPSSALPRTDARTADEKSRIFSATHFFFSALHSSQKPKRKTSPPPVMGFPFDTQNLQSRRSHTSFIFLSYRSLSKADKGAGFKLIITTRP